MTALVLELAVSAAHPAYAGHFPGQPILPGVVLLDEAMHALAVAAGREPATCDIQSAKFLSPVLPGEPLTLHATPRGAAGFRFEILSGTRCVASGALAFGEPQS